METDRLSTLIDEKHRVLTQLRGLSGKQLELAEGGEMTPLLRLLAAKQNLIEELSRIETLLDPFRGQDPDARQWSSPDARQRCAQTAERCQRLLDEILEVERKGESTLVGRRDRAANQLSAAADATRARKAYASSAGAAPRRFDTTSGG
jgi:hypothetical protein